MGGCIYDDVYQDARDEYRHKPWDTGEQQDDSEPRIRKQRPYQGDWRGSVVDDCPPDDGEEG